MDYAEFFFSILFCVRCICCYIVPPVQRVGGHCRKKNGLSGSRSFKFNNISYGLLLTHSHSHQVS